MLDMWLACRDSFLCGFAQLSWEFGGSIRQRQRTEGFAVFVYEHLLSNVRTRCAASSDDGGEYDCSFVLQRVVNDLGQVLHARLSWKHGAMPGLDKHIEDAATDALALHSNLFGQIDLHGVGAPGVNDIESGAPYIGLAASTPDGAGNFAAAIHQHLRSNLTRDGAFALDYGRQRDRFTSF